MSEKRYLRNLGAITEEEQEILSRSSVAVIGCGGLGGSVIANLVRLGVGHITAVDMDSFDESNLNRQLLCTAENIGMPKAAAAERFAAAVNPAIGLRGIQTKFGRDNGAELLSGVSLVIDALDSIASRRELAQICDTLGLPLIHGAIRGWYAQVAVLPAGGVERGLRAIYPNEAAAEDKSCLAFTPAVCAGIQCAEAVKLLLGRETELVDSLMFVDLLNNECEILPLL